MSHRDPFSRDLCVRVETIVEAALIRHWHDRELFPRAPLVNLALSLRSYSFAYTPPILLPSSKRSRGDPLCNASYRRPPSGRLNVHFCCQRLLSSVRSSIDVRPLTDSKTFLPAKPPILVRLSSDSTFLLRFRRLLSSLCSLYSRHASSN
jgi:hypothetical protein